MLYHIIAFLLGVILDWLIGDPQGFPHPVRWIGSLIGKLTKLLLDPYLEGERNKKGEKGKGLILVIAVIAVTVICVAVTSFISYKIHPYFGVFIEAILTCYILAAKSLYAESVRVGDKLSSEGIAEGRKAVSMIVGRDTDSLDEKGVIKAAVETVAENTSDGIIAPLLFTFIGGPILGYAYKAVNTMDSMVGYRNEKYEDFGFFAAKLDDIVNFIPSRLSGLLIIISAFILGKDYSGKDAFRIFKRDRFNHKSPNSAQTESACAGALRVRLAGNASYFGVIHEKPYIGDDLREIEIKDIKRACRLMFTSEILAILICIVIAVII